MRNEVIEELPHDLKDEGDTKLNTTHLGGGRTGGRGSERGST